MRGSSFWEFSSAVFVLLLWSMRPSGFRAKDTVRLLKVSFSFNTDGPCANVELDDISINILTQLNTSWPSTLVPIRASSTAWKSCTWYNHFPTSSSQQIYETPSPKIISLINELADKPLGHLVISDLPIQVCFFLIPFVNLIQLLIQRTIEK